MIHWIWKYGHGGLERFLIAIIDVANVLKDFTRQILNVPVPFRCRQGQEQKQLAFIKYMGVVEPLGSTEDLLGCIFLRRSSKNNISNTIVQVELNPEEPPAPYCENEDF